MKDAFGVSKSAAETRSDRNWHTGLAAGNAGMGGIVAAHTLRNAGKQPKLATAVGGAWAGLSGIMAARDAQQARKAHLALKPKPPKPRP